MYQLLNTIGLMSGTSLDGLDISLSQIYYSENKFSIKPLLFKTYSYDNQLKNDILDCINPQVNLEKLSDINFKLGNYFADKVLEFIKEFKINNVDLIGSHGQTFYHNIKDGKVISTLQLGDGSIIAQKTGITTVSDFRTADIAVNGQGAPLVPFFDKHFFVNDKNIVLQNIGGISNSSYINKNDSENIIAFDNGAGNMIIDSIMKIITKGDKHFDNNGEIALKGQVNQDFLNSLLDNPYFKMTPPKSTGRELFGDQYSHDVYKKAKELNISDIDLISTVTYFISKTIADSLKNFLPEIPEKLVIGGGGAKNLAIKKFLEIELPKTEITTTAKYNLDPDAKESVAFALLAYCNVFGLTNNLKSATGADKDVVMGKISPSSNYKRIIFGENKSHNNQSLELTEANNVLSKNLDNLTPLQIVELMSNSDYDVVNAVEKAKDQIAELLTKIINCFKNDGNLFYIGAGTSGRLGVLDASECPPTFKSKPQKVQGIIAGGNIALTTAVEGAEDSEECGINDVKDKVTSKDIIVGISANGRAKYVLSALKKAKSLGAKTSLITCNYFEKPDYIDTIVVISTGSEILSGSTRLKAGTATKMVLNILTTGAFIKTGKAYGNYMVDLNVSNIKLEKRAVNIIKSITKVNDDIAKTYLDKAKGSVKLALLMILKKIESFEEANKLLIENDGFLRKILSNTQEMIPKGTLEKSRRF